MRYSNFSNLQDHHDWDLIFTIWDDFTQIPKLKFKPGNLKRQAAAYLGSNTVIDDLNKTELRQLLAKAKKMKQSSKKEERARGTQLEKQIQCAFNFKNDH